LPRWIAPVLLARSGTRAGDFNPPLVSRRAAASARRPLRLASKRSLESYLHPQAIFAAGGGRVEFDNEDRVADLIAQNWLLAQPEKLPGPERPRRTRQRLINRAQRWLAREAVSRLSLELLAERGRDSDVLSWFETMGALAPTVSVPRA
jgi:hypothetical protein